MRRTSYRGFSLVELLVVIGIIALLIAILLPVLSKAKEQANAIRCSSNQRQIVLAMMMYANDNHGMLPIPYGVQGNAHLPSLAIWMDIDERTGVFYRWQDGTLWPYVGTTDIDGRAQLFHCPSDYDPRTMTALGDSAPRNYSYVFNGDLYMICAGDTTAALPTSVAGVGVRLQRITEADHKILITESSCTFSGARFNSAINQGQNLMAARHSGRCFVGMADGHVELFDPAELFRPRKGPTLNIVGTKVSPQYAYYLLLPH